MAIRNYKEITRAFGGANVLKAILPKSFDISHNFAPKSNPSASLRLFGEYQPQAKLTNVHKLQPAPTQSAAPRNSLQALMQDIPMPEAAMESDSPQNQLNAQPGFLPEPVYTGPRF